MKHKYSPTLPGFSLIELAVVLIIIGIIAGAVLKGRDLVEAAKIRSLISDIHRLTLAVQLYQEHFGILPGDDNFASQHFSASVKNGDGDGIINEADAKLFWVHLAKAGHISSEKAPSSRFGGQFSIVHNPSKDLPGHWFLLSGAQQQGVLTPKQANLLKGKLGEGSYEDTRIRFMDGKNSASNPCLQKENELNLSHDQPTCLVLAAF